ncbi:MAG: hypothetical protein HOP14_10405 [Acidobacteria bacterium]|nr:hypothetical protein [Acidobacteriota bacterium]
MRRTTPMNLVGVLVFALLAAAAGALNGAPASTDAPAQGSTLQAVAPRPAGAEGPHDYFERLVARRDFWKGLSFRPKPGHDRDSVYYTNQLAKPDDGGYAASNREPLWVTYAPEADANSERQDAARAVIPARRALTELSDAVDASAAILNLVPVPAVASGLGNGQHIKIDDEWITVVRDKSPPYSTAGRITDGKVRVTRGSLGTRATSHQAGSAVHVASNSLLNMVRFPLGTTDGHAYLFTWDAYFTKSWMESGINNYKAFQFSSAKQGGNRGDAIWMEPQLNLDAGGASNRAACFVPGRTLAAARIRMYSSPGGEQRWSPTRGNYLGPDVLRSPLGPRRGDFCIETGRWVRYWVWIEQNADDYDVLHYWVADERQDPVHIYDGLRISVRTTGPTPNSILRWWLELNTSDSGLKRGDERDFVTYLRNFAALVDPPADWSALRVKPVR